MNTFAPRLHRQMRAQRAPVSMAASFVTLNDYRFPELANISPTGAKLRGAPLPPKGTVALLKAGPLEVLCRVVWVKDDQCGVRFDETVPSFVLKRVQIDGAAALEAIKSGEQNAES